MKVWRVLNPNEQLPLNSLFWYVAALLLMSVSIVAGCVTSHLPPDAADENGLVQNAGDPMRCVDLYYNAVLDGNHKQYQFCTLEPMAMDRFAKMVNEHKEKMLKSGLDRVAQPVRGRTEIKKVKGSRGAVVFAISPWTNKEEKFEVVEVGQGWRIVKEVFK